MAQPNLQFLPIGSRHDALWAEVWALYEASFPACERWNGDDYDRAFADPLFEAAAIRFDGAFAGLLFHWKGDGFHYVEHLAVSPRLRGQGVGSRALAAFCEGRHDLLAIATEDRLHQPYRLPLMPGAAEVFALAKQCGAKAVYVSGAGSTVMAVAERSGAEAFYAGLEKGLEQLEGLDGCEAFTLLRLDADNVGATVE